MERAQPQRPVILIAEDDPEILAMLSTQLAKRASRIIEVQDGESAIVEVERHQPDLVILDVMLPGKTGWEVCRHIRQSDRARSAGVIVVTAIGETLNEMTASLYGADAYLDKPFQLAELDRRIDEVLASRAAAAAAR